MSGAALALVLAAALFHAVWNVEAKRSGSPAAFLFAIDCIGFVVFLPVLVVALPALGQIPPAVWALVVASSLLHALYALWLTHAYARADLSVVYTIVRTSPAFVPLLAVPLLGEAISLAGAVGIGLVVASLWQLQSGWRRMLEAGTLFAYGALGATVIHMLCDSEAMRILTEGPWELAIPRSVVYAALLYPLYLPLFAVLGGRMRLAREARRLVRETPRPVLLAAALAVIAFVFVFEALARAPVSYVVAVRQASVLFAALLATVSLGEELGRGRLVALALNVAGVVLISLWG